MGKVEENKQQKRERLLDTAFALFTTKGLTKTSISDIVNNAGVAKGTFYLYFKDKYDLANKLIAAKARHVYLQALERLDQQNITDSADRILFLVDDILNQFQKTHLLLRFINKNLSWGIFKNAITSPVSENDIDFAEIYNKMLNESPNGFRDPEIMLFMIIELVSSTCYSAILYSEPCSLDELKPYLYGSIRLIISQHELK